MKIKIRGIHRFSLFPSQEERIPAYSSLCNITPTRPQCLWGIALGKRHCKLVLNQAETFQEFGTQSGFMPAAIAKSRKPGPPLPIH
jgi:hypothetical protein